MITQERCVYEIKSMSHSNRPVVKALITDILIVILLLHLL